MKRRISAASAALASLIAAVPLQAQQADGVSAETGPAQGAETATVSPPLWLMSCSNQLNPAELLCEISQTIVVSGGGQRIATVSFTRAAGKSETGAIFLLPLGVLLPAGVKVSIGGKEIGSVNYQSCDQQGCYATGPVDEDWLQAMKTNDQLLVEMKSRNGQDIRLTIQLEGFTTAEAMFP